MKKNIKVNKPNIFLLLIRGFLIGVFIMSFFLIFEGNGVKKFNNSENLIEINSTISEVYQDNDNKILNLKLKGYDYNFDFYKSDIDFNINFHSYLGKLANIIIDKNDLDDNYNSRAIKLIINNNVIIDSSDTIYKIGTNLVYFGFGCLIFSFIGLFVVRLLKRKKKEIEIPYYQYAIKNRLLGDFRKYQNTIFYDQYISRIKVNGLLMFLLFINLISIFIFTLFINLDNEIISDIIFIGLLVLLVILMILVLIKNDVIYFNKNRKIKNYINEFKQYLNTKSAEFDEIKDSFNSSELIVVDDKNNDEHSILYSKLNFYCAVYYSNEPFKSKIYLISDLNNDEYDYLEHDLIVELDGNLYNLIKEFNIPVRGLDYLINNLEKELNKNINSNKIIDYKN